MQLQIPDHISGVAYYAAGVIAPVTLILVLKVFASRNPELGKIPTFGSNTWLGSWWDSIRFVTNAADVIQEGYEKYKGDPFKISTFYCWLVVVSGRQHVEDLRKCRDDELNMMEVMNDVLKMEHTFEHDTHYDHHHIATLRSKLLNRNLREDLFADIKDEIVTGFDETLNLEGHHWKSVSALSTVKQLISRTSNRIFVGLPLCRDPDWVHLTMQVTLDVFKMAAIISLFPKFMSPLVARFMNIVSENSRRSFKHLAPIIEARQKHLDEHGSSWPDKPNDLLSWLMEELESSRRPVRDIISRVLISNFAAIHSASNVFTQALYILAANPQYVQVLREEVEPIIKEEGWTKASLAKMHKVDSFIKETQRMYGPFLTTVLRKAMKDVTFSDGTVIPKGTYVVLASQSIHLDDKFYDNAATFDPFRFSNMRKEDSDDTKYHSATISPEYLVFGNGRHACPGRFFAATELDAMLAHLVITYDIKLEENATFPQSLEIGPLVEANHTARVMFRRRAA